MDRKRNKKLTNGMENNKKICLSKINDEFFLGISSGAESVFYLVFKRGVDIFFGLVGFAFFIIFFPFFALPIKLETKSSVLYKQERVGRGGKIFTIYKFRTLSEGICGGKWKEKDKNCVTIFGKFLRRTHLDEVPQCLNLIFGEMSFIGPRAEWAELAKIFEEKIPFYVKRYSVKPGLIGWAQINFPPSRSVEEAREKFEYDLYYIKNRSVAMDLEIILKSIKIFLYK